MENESVLIVSVKNKEEIDVHKVLSDIHLKILGEYHDSRGNISISMNNDDWLWLLDNWACFYLGSRMETKEPELSAFQQFFIRLGLMKKPEKPATPSISTVYLKQFRNEMSDGKYLFVNGRKIPVKVT